VYYLQLILAGISLGAVYSLAGIGVVLTYRATGVFNFAHGSIAVLAAYAYWQMGGTLDDAWGWPSWLAAILAIFVLGPIIGFVLEVAVFRPLERSGASTVEKLVATVGAFVLAIGVVAYIWTFRKRDVPELFSRKTIHLFGSDDLTIGFDQLMTVVAVAVICLLLYVLFQRTHLGTEIRAVVDRRELAELAAIDSDRVSTIAWMLGATMSALTGVLLATLNTTLNPYELSLFVIETFSIAVIARLRSFTVAAVSGIVLLGVGQSLLRDPALSISGGSGFVGETFNNLKPNLSVVLLFAALLIYRRLDDRDDLTIAVRVKSRTVSYPGVTVVATGVIVLAALVLPLTLDFATFQYAHQMLALIVIFASIVAITGFAGQITLGQTAFAGIGAFASARIANQFNLPVIIAMLLGGLIAMAAGFLVGYPALRRRGLFLGLVTLAVALLCSRFVFESPQFAGGVNGLQVKRPALFGIGLDGDVAFYFYELVVVALVLLLARNLRSGRLGRALAAMRDSEAGAKAVGIDLRSYKLFIFSISAFMAGIGGAMLSQQSRSFSFITFQPLVSLFWFAAVVVAGVSTVYGAVLAGVLYVVLDVLVGTDGASQALIGLTALVLGVLPGRSLLGVVRHLGERLEASFERYRDAATARETAKATAIDYEPSPLARRLLADRGTAEARRS
jgi:branched-chain amino acid transport system permease protein